MEAGMNEDIRLLNELRTNLESCIFGKSYEITLLLTALLAGGHVLLEDVPGTGKTVLVKSLAKSIQGVFRRIQCNPDLLPTDITGVSIYHPKEETFLFRPGPVMANILLADEINRATTKTQAALLEAMEERHVTADGELYPLPVPFLLLATQNPIDFEGTYVLPEAQLDRFMLKLSLGYPDRMTEKQMILSQTRQQPLDRLKAVADVEAIAALQSRVREVYLDDSVAEYIVDVVGATRNHNAIYLGASPRAALSLTHAAQGYAYLHHRNYVIPDDIKTLAAPVLAHRMVLTSEARMAGNSVESVLQSVFSQIRVPVRLEK
ncbi:AAA family ATPase [Paenibacillus sp. y28]|uniref:AAA family ATPase n=1 Tax=Paenibacillus sp. y28 TaxID=3129110 RepID=UPI00301ADDE9